MSNLVAVAREIPLSQIQESAWNPRHYFAAGPMAELTASIKSSGVWTPIMVRPTANGYYEIAAGHRRKRAAETAGLETIPCLVRELSDAEFIELLSFENSNRENVHPLDEASGIQFYRQQTGATIPQLAEKMGVSQSQIWARLKLLDLTEELQRAFWDGKITAGHAVPIARLSPEMQSQALQQCYGWHVELMSVRELQEWIAEQKLGKLLEDAPFALADAELLPTAGACDACSKRSDDLCSDRACFEAKIEAAVRRKAAEGLVAVSTEYRDNGPTPAGVLVRKEFQEVREEPEEDLPFDNDPPENDEAETQAPIQPSGPVCTSAEQAVVAQGPDRGSVIRICRDLQCLVHGPGLRYEAERKASEPQTLDYWSERAEALPRKIEYEARLETLQAVLAVPLKWAVRPEQLRLLADALLPYALTDEFLAALAIGKASFGNGSANAAAVKKMIRDEKSAPFLPRIVLGLSLHEAAKEYCGIDDRLKQAAQVLGVDAKKIAAQTAKRMNDEFQAQRDKARAKKKAAKKKAAKSLRKEDAPHNQKPSRSDSSAGAAAEMAAAAPAPSKAQRGAKAQPGTSAVQSLENQRKSKAAAPGIKPEPIASSPTPGAPRAASVFNLDTKSEGPPSYAIPNVAGDYPEPICQVISCVISSLNAALYTVQCEDGFRFGCRATLPDKTIDWVPRQKDKAAPTLEVAINKACRLLLGWTNRQAAKEFTKKAFEKKQRAEAQRLKGWLEMLLEDGVKGTAA